METMANPFRLFKNPINVYFVGIAKFTLNYRCKNIVAAYQECQDAGVQPKWILLTACLDMKPKENDVFVLENFEGPIFKQLQTSKCSIFGPPYILHHLHANKPIPPEISPVFNTSMQDVVAHLSGYTPTDKLFYQQRILQMNGNICTKPSCPCITHLIFDSPQQILPKEYDRAKAKGIEVFTKDWITLVWTSNPKVQPRPDNIPLPDPYPLPSPILAPQGFDSPPKRKEQPRILQGLKFIVRTSNRDEDDFTEEDISDLKGEVVTENFRGTPDFAVVPFNAFHIKTKGKEIVTRFYIDDCYEKKAKVNFRYYHRPVYISKDLKPLKDCVISMSQYSGSEKNYLSNLAKELGADWTDDFDNKCRTTKRGFYVTHCVCKSPEGQKYNAAVKWKIPAVTGEWLRACYDEMGRVDEGPFLVGDSKAPERKKTVAKSGLKVMMDLYADLEYGDQARAVARDQKHGYRAESMKKFKFMTTGYKGEERMSLEKLIRKLGGEVVMYYDDSVTHLVSIDPSKATPVKIFACIAGGKWVLHESYLRDSEKFGGFLDEGKYEWGNPLNYGLAAQLEDANARKIAAAAYKWRLKIKDKGRKVFVGMKAVLMAHWNEYDGYERVIKAGGGTVVDRESLYGSLFSSREGITHRFVDDAYKNTKVVMGRPCYSLDFMFDLIMNDAGVNQRDHVVPEYTNYFGPAL